MWLIASIISSPPGLASGRAGIFGGGTMNYLRLLKVFFRVNVAGELAYRINFFINLFQSLLGWVPPWPDLRLFSLLPIR